MGFRQLWPFAALGVVVVVCFLLGPRPERGDTLEGWDRWNPTPAAIAAAVGSGPAGTASDSRHHLFASMFQQRYRDHGLPVGARFLPDGRLRAMFAPTMTRWHMAEIATELQAEAGRLFGAPIPVDLYETYVTAPMKKVAELRTSPGGRTIVCFDDRFSQRDPQQMAWQ